MNLSEFIKKSPTQFHAVSVISQVLFENGFEELNEYNEWQLERGKKYFTTRNGSAVIAFTVPDVDIQRFMITASHSDSPCLKIKDNPELLSGNYKMLSTEVYGGMLYSTWLDRPLGIAGRITVKTENGFEVKIVDFGKACAVVPNVAIHLKEPPTME